MKKNYQMLDQHKNFMETKKAMEEGPFGPSAAHIRFHSSRAYDCPLPILLYKKASCINNRPSGPSFARTLRGLWSTQSIGDLFHVHNIPVLILRKITYYPSVIQIGPLLIVL